MQRILLPLVFALVAGSVQAATPAELLAAYRDDAARDSAGFQPSASRGKVFYHQNFGKSAQMPACAGCHTDDPAAPGRHAITGKSIKPLAPAAAAERFSDAAKVEKWFGRNCKEVVGRPCSAAEKADFIAYLTEGR